MPRPPILKTPALKNGTERVTILGVMSLMTITSDGFDGMSLDDMAKSFGVALELL